ncbi:hypothetical protein RJT34_11723 [Clitoria ternatea]|uniref:Exocyst subunit Exo70 family protein n=1 Tax=Clitoria ternatea TaxID=43366 RepID=A0AAN9PKR4_CLITE
MARQILSWLVQPRVCRFISFTSSVVGLLVYSLSSSFNRLFGKWNLWKILLYIIFSFIICLSVLFAKVCHCQRSPSFRLEAQLAFLVLIITSVYSFFYDKVLNGKPDAYSIISNAAFAIMSLGLSREIHCGIEVDLLYFFSGCLIVQLMKIKLCLFIVGAGVSYSLIVLRSYFDAPEENGHFRQQVQDEVVIQVYSHSLETNNNSTIQMDSPPANIENVSEASPLNRDIKFVATQVNSHSQGGNNDHSDFIMSCFMASIEALKKENRKLIHTVSNHVERSLKFDDDSDLEYDDTLVMDTLPSGIIKDLQKTVNLMVATGLKEECCHMYSGCRRGFLEEWLLSFELQELNMEDIYSKMEKIESWTKAFNVAVKVLFPNEKRLCDRVFKRFSSAADITFTEICKELTMHLLSFSDTLATGMHLLDFWPAIGSKVIKTLRNLDLEFESLLPNQSSVSLLRQVFMVWKILPLKIRIHSLICYDIAQPAAPNGGIQWITLKVMNYLRGIPKIVTCNREISSRGSHTPCPYLASVMVMLESNLEAKSRNYSDPVLGYVFKMNNYRCIDLGAKVIGLEPIFGDDWFQKNKAKVQQNLELYQRSSWNKLLDFLKLNNNELEQPNVADSVKVKLDLFNLHFEEICNIRSTWPVFDKQLRKQIIASLENILLPAYGNFIGRIRNVLGKQCDEYIKYGIFHIQDRLNHLFLENLISQSLDLDSNWIRNNHLIQTWI